VIFIVFISSVVIFGVFGVVQLIFTLDIKENMIDYKAKCKSNGSNLGTNCVINDFTIKNDMDGPVYVYYQMTNFF